LPTKHAFRFFAVLTVAFLLLPSFCKCAEEELSIDEEIPEVATPATPTSAPTPAPAPAPVAQPAPIAPVATEVPAAAPVSTSEQPAVVPVQAEPVAPQAETIPTEAIDEPAQADAAVEEEAPAGTAEEETAEEHVAEPEVAPVDAATPEAPVQAVIPEVAPVVPVPAEAIPEPEVAPAPTPQKAEVVEPAVEDEGNLTIDESDSPVAGEGTGIVEEELVPDTEASAIPAFQWNPRDSKGAFAEFLNAGISGVSAGYFPAKIVSVSADKRLVAVKNEDVIISGNWRKGQVLAVYQKDNGNKVLRLTGLVSAIGSSGKGNTRATVIRSDDYLEAGNNLLPVEQLQEEFSEQRNSAGRARLIQAGAEGIVLSSGDNNSIYPGGEEYLLVSRGKRHGVGLAWLCEQIIPGKIGGTTYGRVVRVDSETCFVRIMKLYQPVQKGDRVKLSISPLVEPNAKSPSKH